MPQPFATSSSADSTVTVKSRRLHIDFVDSFRGLAALYVVMHHILIYFWPPWGPPPRNPLVRVANEFFFYGRYAVAIFIVLSGFCLALPVIKEGRMRHTFGQFIWRRARRILAPYYAALVLSLLFIAVTSTARTETIWDDSVNLTWLGVAANLFAVQNWFGAQAFGQINYVFWSVAVEWNIYFFFPLILWLWSRLSSRALATSLILPVTIALAWFWKDGHWAYQNVQFLGLFALGMYAANLAITKQSSLRLRLSALGTALISSLIVFIVTARLGWMHANHLWPLLDLGVGIPTAALLVYLVHSPKSRLRQILSLKPLVAVGLFSYSIYLVHAPIVQGVWLCSTKTLGLSFFPTLGIMLGVGLPLVLVLAYAFHLVFEKPFLNSSVKPPPASPSTS